MAKRFVNKRTKKFLKTKEEAGNDPVSDNWKGRIYITNPEKSFIAQQVAIKEEGEYAIKVQ